MNLTLILGSPLFGHVGNPAHGEKASIPWLTHGSHVRAHWNIPCERLGIEFVAMLRDRDRGLGPAQHTGEPMRSLDRVVDD
jgi:hypothetical protein